MNAVTARRAPPWWLRDFRHIRLAALVFAMVAGGALAAVAGTRLLWHEARDRQLAAAQARDLARRQVAQVEQEKRDIALFQPIYRELLARRLVGTENRLDWLDALRQMQDQYRLPPIAYDIAPRQPVVVSPAMDLGRYRLYTTRMRVQMDLLHEGDLFALLSGLRALGHSTVQECTLKRPTSAPNTPLAPTVTAACTLNWVTLAAHATAGAVHPDAVAQAPQTRGGAGRAAPLLAHGVLP
jgi:hypothetical protein